MTRLKLEVDGLAVESFATADEYAPERRWASTGRPPTDQTECLTIPFITCPLHTDPGGG